MSKNVKLTALKTVYVGKPVKEGGPKRPGLTVVNAGEEFEIDAETGANLVETGFATDVVQVKRQAATDKKAEQTDGSGDGKGGDDKKPDANAGGKK